MHAPPALWHSPDPQPRRALISDKALTSLPECVAGERPARPAVEGHGWAVQWVTATARRWARWPGRSPPHPAGAPRASAGTYVHQPPSSWGQPGPEPSARGASGGPLSFCGPQLPVLPTSPASSCCRGRPPARAARAGPGLGSWVRARLGRVPTAPERAPCEGRGFGSQHSLAQASLAHLCLHVRVCAHACVPCRSSRQPPRRDLDVPVPTGVPISWPRATFGLADSEPAQFPG